MTRHILAFCALNFALLSAEAPLLGHHSFAAEYDSTKPIKFTGTVQKMEWRNPHIYFYVDVKDASGKVIIPANSTIIFDVKLVKVKPGTTTPQQ